MKQSRLASGIALAIALIVAPALFAAQNEGRVRISQNVMLNGTNLPPGDYKVQWSGEGNNVQVSLIHRNKTVATANGQIVTSENGNPSTGYGTQSNPSGAPELNQIFFEGKKFVLNLASNSAS